MNQNDITARGEENVVGSCDIGNATRLTEKHTLTFAFHDFEDLPYESGDFTESSYLLCHNYLWALALYPGGDGNTTEEEGVFTSLYLKCKSTDDDIPKAKAKFSFRTGNRISDGKNRFDLKGQGSGWCDYFEREIILSNYLESGTFTIKVDLQLYQRIPKWAPVKRNLQNEMLNLLHSGNMHDIYFQVGDVAFPAHKCMIAKAAPELLNYATDPGYQPNAIIDNVRPDVFQLFLEFIYTAESPPEEIFKRDAMELLDLSDRFGCTNLKHLSESIIVQNGINIDNAADMIIFAEHKCCALLKEAAMIFFKSNPFAIMSSNGWQRGKESGDFTVELMESIFNTNDNEPEPEPEQPPQPPVKKGGSRFKVSVNKPKVPTIPKINYKTMDVTTLRNKLQDMGLDCDGTKESLIQRLKDSSHLQSETQPTPHYPPQVSLSSQSESSVYVNNPQVTQQQYEAQQQYEVQQQYEAQQQQLAAQQYEAQQMLVAQEFEAAQEQNDTATQYEQESTS